MVYQMQKVIMTGGTSGIGLALIRKLLENYVEITMLRRKKTDRDMELPNNERLNVEFCSLEELENYDPGQTEYDVFFHLGWGNSSKEGRNDITQQMENVRYACNAVKVAARCGCHTFIGIGSQAEYGRCDEVLTPDTVCQPETAYGVAKWSACYATKLLCKQMGIRHIWARVLSGYGLYDNPRSLLCSTIVDGLSGKMLSFTRGEQIWDFVHFDDIANALYLMALRGKAYSIYVIGSGQARPLREYIMLLCKKMDLKIGDAFGKCPYQKCQVMHLEGDYSTLECDTGWRPEIEFDEGIERLIEFYKRKLLLEGDCNENM